MVHKELLTAHSTILFEPSRSGEGHISRFTITTRSSHNFYAYQSPQQYSLSTNTNTMVPPPRLPARSEFERDLETLCPHDPSLHDGNSDCPICLESMLCDSEASDSCECFSAPKPIARLANCKHTYHDSCLDTWLSERRTCPTCRRELFRAEPEYYTPTGFGAWILSSDGENAYSSYVASWEEFRERYRPPNNDNDEPTGGYRYDVPRQSLPVRVGAWLYGLATGGTRVADEVRHAAWPGSMAGAGESYDADEEDNAAEQASTEVQAEKQGLWSSHIRRFGRTG